MSIPSKARIEWELLVFLHDTPMGMVAADVYLGLAKCFSELSESDLSEPYPSDKSGCRWNTEVRSAIDSLKKRGFVSQTAARGIWTLTDKGHEEVVVPLGGII